VLDAAVSRTEPRVVLDGGSSADDSPPLSVVGLHANSAGTNATTQIDLRRVTAPTVPTAVGRVCHSSTVATGRSARVGTIRISVVSEGYQTGRRCTLPS